jgi:hypothetical protein
MKLEARHARPTTQDHEVPVVRASAVDQSAARDLLVRRIARLAFLIDLGSPEIIIRNELRLVGEALVALLAPEKPDVWPGLLEPSAARKSGRNQPRKRSAIWCAGQNHAFRSSPSARSAISTNGEYR